MSNFVNKLPILTIDIAEDIVRLIDTAYSVGQLALDTELLSIISAHYPELVNKYSWLPWEEL